MQKTLTIRPGWKVRVAAATAAVVLLTPFLVHPEVPQLARSLRAWGSLEDVRNFGYFAHSIAYFSVSLFVLTVLRPARTRMLIRILALLILHGIATETAQYWIPGRDGNLLDMACNVFSVLAAGAVRLCLTSASRDRPGMKTAFE